MKLLGDNKALASWLSIFGLGGNLLGGLAWAGDVPAVAPRSARVVATAATSGANRRAMSEGNTRGPERRPRTTTGSVRVEISSTSESAATPTVLPAHVLAGMPAAKQAGVRYFLEAP